MHPLAARLRASPPQPLAAEPPGGRPPFGTPEGASKTIDELREQNQALQREIDGMGKKHLLLLLLGVLGGVAVTKAFSGPSYRSNPAWRPGAFQRMVDELVAQGHSEESARKIAASIGRAKYGQAEMTRRAQLGKKAKNR